jgi:hypothetical protein
MRPIPQNRIVPTCRPANVAEVQKINENVVLVPILPLNDSDFLATVIVDFLAHGLPFDELRRRYHLPAGATSKQYIDYVAIHGRRIYSAADPDTGARAVLPTPLWNLPEPVLPGESDQAYERRTGCPSRLFHLAMSAQPPQPHPLADAPTPEDRPRKGRRRILTTK